MPEQTKQFIPDPTLRDLLKELKSEIMAELNCAMPGKIVSFDGAAGTAEVQPLFSRVAPDGTIIALKNLVDVPVWTPQGGGAAQQFPVAPGDDCLLIFMDRSKDTWFQTGSAAAPPGARMHSLSDAVALIGLAPATRTLPTWPTDEARAVILNGGKVAVDVSGLLSLKNEVSDLKTLIFGLIDAIAAAAITDESATWPLNPASIALLQAQKLLFQGLLK